MKHRSEDVSSKNQIRRDIIKLIHIIDKMGTRDRKMSDHRTADAASISVSELMRYKKEADQAMESIIKSFQDAAKYAARIKQDPNAMHDVMDCQEALAHYDYMPAVKAFDKEADKQDQNCNDAVREGLDYHGLDEDFLKDY